MSQPFLDEYKMFINNRTTRINTDDVIKNAEYIKLSHESIALYHSIFDNLPQDYKDLISDYENTLNLMRSISDDTMYEHGLRDGMKLRIILFQ